MVFNSYVFALFLPVVFLIYWALAGDVRLRNLWTVAASWFFYAWWDWRFLGLLVGSTVVSYFCGIAIGNCAGSSRRRAAAWLLALNIAVNLGVLFVFKYCDFFVQTFAALLRTAGIEADWVTLEWVLPVGISFYTFQALGYTIDVYRGNIRATRDAAAYFAYISFFPQLVAGPIERATNLIPQMKGRIAFDYQLAVSGMKLILWGLFKKMVIADNCAVAADYIFGNYSGLGGAALLTGVVMFTFQIYGDFSGYSDMAVGVARLFGIRLMQNFNRPYFSRSVGEFWRRWHISLSTWLRDYLYIPLGGNRRGALRKSANLTVVFLASGLWHGANLTFVLWGAWHALCNSAGTVAGKILPAPRGRTASVVSWTLAMGAVMLGWLVFRSPDITSAWLYLKAMFSHHFAGLIPVSRATLAWVGLFVVIECAAEFGFNPPQKAISLWHKSTALRWTFYIIAFLSVLFAGGEPQTFVYFQF